MPGRAASAHVRDDHVVGPAEQLPDPVDAEATAGNGRRAGRVGHLVIRIIEHTGAVGPELDAVADDLDGVVIRAVGDGGAHDGEEAAALARGGAAPSDAGAIVAMLTSKRHRTFDVLITRLGLQADAVTRLRLIPALGELLDTEEDVEPPGAARKRIWVVRSGLENLGIE